MAEEILNIEDTQGGDPLGILSSKKAVTSNIEDTDPLGILKKKSIPSESLDLESQLKGLPKEQVGLLQKGVEEQQVSPRLKKFIGEPQGLQIPTNLPVSEQKKYESELLRRNAAVNTLMDTYKVKGLKFNPESPAGKKQIDSYLENLKNNDLVLVEGKDKKPYLTRSQSTLETFGKSVFNSIKAPIEAVKVNTMNDPQDFADYMDEKIKNEPNIPESAPSGALGYVTELAGGVPKMAALLSIPGFGESAIVTEMYHTSLANQREQLYRKGLSQGLSRIDAAKQAMQAAPITAIPDAAMGVVLGRGFSGGSLVPEAPKKALVDALMTYAKGTAKVAGAGALSENARAGLEQLEGYKLKEGERAERTLQGASDWAIMHTAFDRGGWVLKNAPKFVSSAYKNFLTNIPKPILEAEAANYPNGKEILDQVESFAETKKDVQDLVPEEKVASVTGLTEKIKNIQSDIYELETRKVKAPDVLKPYIDRWIQEYKDEIEFYNKQIGKVTKSSDPTGLSEEIDNVTGQKAGTKNYVVDGKQVSQAEFEAMQGKPQGTKTFVEEVKPTEEETKKAEIENLEKQYNNLADIVNAQNRPINEPKTKEELDLINIGTKLNKLREEVKPTEVKEEVKAEEPIAEEIKPKIDIENKKYITKKGNVIDFEEGKLIVKDKEGNILSDRASKKSISEYIDNYDFSIGKKVEVPDEITDSREQAKYAVENTNSPLEVAEIYSSETPMPFETDAKMQAIAEHGLGRIKTSSYERFGDPNKIEKSMYLNVFSEKRGQTIDQLAQEISAKGLEIEPKDIVDYIEKYSKGAKKALELQETDVQLMAKDKFKQLTGLDLDSELSNKIIDKELQKLKQQQLDIIKEDYETAKQLEDAYWKAYNETDGFTKESITTEAVKTTGAEKEIVTPKKEEYAVQKPSTKEILQRPQGGVGEAGGERPRMEPSLKREKITGEGKEAQPEGIKKENVKPLKLNDKAILNRLYESENISDSVKRKFEENDLKYKVASQEEAKKIASEIVKEYGTEDAIALAEAGKFDGDVNSFIFSKSIDDIAQLELNSKTPEEKSLYGQQWADYALRFDEAARKGGRFISAISDFYRKSPLGVKIYEETRRKEVFKDWLKDKESDIKDVYKQILEQPEFKDLIKEEAQKEIKKERAEARKEKRQKIDDFFENAKLKGNNLYAVPIPVELINGALEIMKQATLAGESVTFAVQQAVNHISKEIKEWDSEKFRNEYETKLKGLISEKKEKSYDDLLKERIKNLEKQIKDYEEKIEQGGVEAKKRIGKFDNVEEVKKLIEERDKLRKENEKLTRKPTTTKEEAILKRIEKLEIELKRVQERREKEKVEKGTVKEKQITEEEKALKEAIYAENEKWDSEIDAARNAANDYKKLETERNRQLKRVGELKDKLNILEGGNLPESKKREIKLDTPEIESLKEQVKEAEKSVRENISHENKLKKLEEELNRLKNRKKKEKRLDDKIEISDDESEIRRKIEEERLSWKVEENIAKLNEELQRIKDRKEKVTELKQKRQLTAEEEKLTQDIKYEKEKWSKELEPKRKQESEIKRKRDRIAELNRRIEENDYTAEAYKAKKEKTILDEELDRVKELYNEARKSSKEYIDKKSRQYLDRFGKKLKTLTDGQKEEVIKKSITKLIDNGALEFDEFKDIISNTLGLGKIGDEEFQKLKEYSSKINRVGELRENIVKEENRTQQNLDEYYKAQKEASLAVKDLNKIIYTKPDITNRLLGVMQLNTLGIASLAANVTYNVFNQSLIRFPRALVETGLENFVFGTTYALNKINGTNIIYPDNIPFAGQKEFFNKLGEGIKIATKQILTGERKYDYLQKEIFTSQIHPFTSAKELWQFKKGELNLSKEQVADKAIQATVGIPAEVVARLLNLGDTPERYAAEGAVASSFAKKYGLSDINYKFFLEFPKEIAYQEERKLGKSAEEATKKAEYVEKRIIDAGAESVMQQDNIINDMINAAVTGAAKYGKNAENAVKIVKVLNMPYLKIPLNTAWSFYNLANPEIAFTQSMIYGAKYLKTKDASDIQNSKKWFAHGMVGLAFLGIAGYLSKNGIINSSNDGKDTKKEREGERFYERQGMINISKLNALLKGEDPNKVKESYNIDLKYFGTSGDILDMQAKKVENMTPEQRKNGVTLTENMLSNLNESTSKVLQSGAFTNTSTLLNAFNQNNTSVLNGYLTGLINMGANIVQPATFAQMSRSQLPYYTQAKADNYFDELKNNFLTRSSTLRALTGKYPPSKIGIWGDTLENKEDYMLKIFGISKSNKDNFAQPIYDDYKRTNNLKFFPPSIKPEVNGIKLDVQQQQELEQLVGNQRKFMVTPFVNDGAILKSFKKVYSELDDDDKTDALRVIYEEGYKKGEEQFIMNHKEFYKPSKKTKEEKAEAREVSGFRKSIKRMFK